MEPVTGEVDVNARIRASQRHPFRRWVATVRLGLRMAVYARAKFIGTLLGVVFASMLANFQLGTMFGLLAKNTIFVDNAGADIWITPVGTTFAQPGPTLPASLVARARVTPGVANASGLVMTSASVKKPAGGGEGVTLVGVDTDTMLGGPFNLVAGSPEALRAPDTLIVEDSQRDLLGAVNLGSVREVGGRQIRVGGFTWGLLPFGPAFAFADQDLAREIGNVADDEVSFVLVTVRPSEDVDRIARELQRQAPTTLVLTRDAFHDLIVSTLLSQQLGVTFGVSTAFGLLVGFVIVLLSMYSAVLDNLRELGTLKAIGYTNADLGRMLVAQAVLYGVLGSILGLGLVAGAADGIRSAQLSLVLPRALVLATAPAMVTLCTFASLLAFYRAARLEPGAVFR